MRILSVLLIPILICLSSPPILAAQIIINLGAASYVTLPSGDFNALDPDAQKAWIDEQKAKLTQVLDDIASLNSLESDALVAEIKRDRCCSRTLNWCWRGTSVLIFVGGIASSAIDGGNPVWLGYAMAAVAALNSGLGHGGDYFRDQEVENTTDLQELAHDMALDIIDKQRLYDENVARDQEVIELRRERDELRSVISGGTGPGDGGVVLLPEPATSANLRAYHSVRGGEELAEIEEGCAVPLQRSDKGKEEDSAVIPPAAQPPLEPPVKWIVYKKTLKKKKSAVPAKQAESKPPNE